MSTQFVCWCHCQEILKCCVIHHFQLRCIESLWECSCILQASFILTSHMVIIVLDDIDGIFKTCAQPCLVGIVVLCPFGSNTNRTEILWHVGDMSEIFIWHDKKACQSSLSKDINESILLTQYVLVICWYCTKL